MALSLSRSGLFCLGDTLLFPLWKGLVSLLFLFFHLSFFISKLVSHRKVYVLYRDVVVITLCQELLEIAQVIFLEDGILDVMSVLFLCPSINNLFLIPVERQFFPSDSDCDAPWLIFRGEGNAPMLKCLPLCTCSRSSITDDFFQFYLKPSTIILKRYPVR